MKLRCKKNEFENNFNTPLTEGCREKNNNDETFKNANMNTNTYPINKFVNIHELNEKVMFNRLILRCVVFFLYFLLGASLLNQWLGWDAITSVYFTVVTFTTIGYGDYAPASRNERFFVCFYALFGVGLYGSTIGLLVSYNHERRGRMKAEQSQETYERIQTALLEEDNKDKDKDKEDFGTSLESFHDKYIDTNSDIESDNESEYEDETDVEKIIKTSEERKSKIIKLKSENKLEKEKEKQSRKSTDKMLSRVSTALRSFSSMSLTFRLGLNSKEKLKKVKAGFVHAYENDIKAIRKRAAVNFGLILFIIVLGACVFAWLENADPLTSFYWAVISMLTIGYGDIVPTTIPCKVFVIIYALIGVVVLSQAVLDVSTLPIAIRVKQHELEILNQYTGDLSKQKLSSIFSSNIFRNIDKLRTSDKTLSKSEFVLMVLNMMRKVDEKDILLVSMIFDKLDKTASGTLSEDDIASSIMNAEDEVESVGSSKTIIQRGVEKVEAFSEGLFQRIRTGSSSSMNSNSSTLPLFVSNALRPTTSSRLRSNSNASGSSSVASEAPVVPGIDIDSQSVSSIDEGIEGALDRALREGSFVAPLHLPANT